MFVFLHILIARLDRVGEYLILLISPVFAHTDVSVMWACG